MCACSHGCKLDGIFLSSRFLKLSFWRTADERSEPSFNFTRNACGMTYITIGGSSSVDRWCFLQSRKATGKTESMLFIEILNFAFVLMHILITLRFIFGCYVKFADGGNVEQMNVT